jgi:1,4-dihydroxy-2-naphthoyl-CoA hydrolase
MSDAPDTSIPVDEFLKHMPYGMGGMNEKLGVELLYVSADRVEGRMPVAGNEQPMGLLHGGASIALAETLGSVGSAIHAMANGAVAVGVDINATHHRAATSGFVHATATAIHLGRTSAAYEIVITNDAGKRVCTSRITCAIVPADRFA